MDFIVSEPLLPRARGTAVDSSELPKMGRFVLLDLLGRGGMANVYLAAMPSPIGALKLVVLKCVQVRGGPEAELARMFADEARLACLLAHPNVVTCYEAGVLDEEAFLAMEYLDGQPLSRVVRLLEISGRRAPARVAARIACDVLRGLHYAHTLKGSDGRPLDIVHRDVSPANVFVTYDGAVKVLDFGIAKWALSDVRTATGFVKGKLAYMAPEQALTVPVDARADVFAAGVTLWELLSGRRLHGDARAEALLARVLTGTVPRLRDSGVDASPALDEIVARATARDREGRFVDAAHFREAIEAASAEFGGVATELEVGAFVASLFAGEREHRARALREQVARLERQSTRVAPSPRPPAPRLNTATTVPAPDDAPTMIDTPVPVTSSAPRAGAKVAVAVALAATVAALVVAAGASRAPSARASGEPRGAATAAP